MLYSKNFTWYQSDCRSEAIEDTSRENLIICSREAAVSRDSVVPELEMQKEEGHRKEKVTQRLMQCLRQHSEPGKGDVVAGRSPRSSCISYLGQRRGRGAD